MEDSHAQLQAGDPLTREESRVLFGRIMSGELGDDDIVDLLLRLNDRGPTVDEVVGAATAMRERAVPIVVPAGQVVLDTCGTGGDVKGTFNISTASALLIAATGVKVVKHGNRSATSRSGSADVLEALNVRLDLSPQQQAEVLESANICFAFARQHHPAMKNVAAARSRINRPTLFNLLGPLTNPARAGHQLMGAYAPHLLPLLAGALNALGSTRAWVVHAHDGLDELSTLVPTEVCELRDGGISTFTVDPRELGFVPPTLSDLQVASPQESAAMIRSIVEGRPGPGRDIAVLNAAAGLVIVGRCETLTHALPVVEHAIDSGAADQTLTRLSAFVG